MLFPVTVVPLSRSPIVLKIVPRSALEAVR